MDSRDDVSCGLQVSRKKGYSLDILSEIPLQTARVPVTCFEFYFNP